MRVIQSTTLALLLGTAAAAQGADLMDIFRMAQTADAQYAAARASWSAGQEKLPQGLSGLLPSAALSANTQYNDRNTDSRDPTVPTVTNQFNSNSATISVTQPLYRPQNYTAYQQSKSQVEQADAVFAQAAQDLILRVAQAYLDVLLAQDTIVFAQAQLTAIGRQLEQAKRNFEVGTATITDTHEAQSRYDLTVSLEITAKNDLEIRKRFLELIIGRAGAGNIAPRAQVQPAFSGAERSGCVGGNRGHEQPAGAHQPGEPGLRHQGSRAQSRRAPADTRCLRKLYRLGQRARHHRDLGCRHEDGNRRACSWRYPSTRAGSSARACARRSPTRKRPGRTWTTRAAPRS